MGIESFGVCGIAVQNCTVEHSSANMVREFAADDKDGMADSGVRMLDFFVAAGPAVSPAPTLA
jgi:hypothetical protein